jgi:iron(III) transport system substrate-binding protein
MNADKIAAFSLVASLLLASLVAGANPAGAQAVDAELTVPKDWLEKAKAEGKLILYSTETPQQEAAILKPFYKRYPFIMVDYLKAATDVRYQKLLQSARQGAPIADIVTGIGGVLKSYIDAQTLAELTDLPTWRVYGDEVKYGTISIAFRKRYYSLAYNTDRVSKKDVPKTWEDLLNPKWSGEVAFNSIAYAVWLNPLWHSLGPEKTRKLIEGFGRNKAQFRAEGADAAVRLLAAGEFNFAIPVSEYNAYEVVAARGPVDWLALDPLPVGLGNILIMKKAAHPFAAKLYVNWILSYEGQEIYAKVTRANPVHPNLQGKSFNFPDLPQRIKGKKLAVRTAEMEMGWGKDHPGMKLWQSIALGGL